MSDVRRCVGVVAAIVGALALVTVTKVAVAQQPTPPALKEPVALGAWLYAGQCTRCHGAYERERVGRGKTSEELVTAIADGGCSIRWGRDQGGPLPRSEIKALVAYMLAWEKLDGPPPLPDLPPQPTPTPTPTRPADTARPSPTPTPTAPVMDERTRLIVAGNQVAHGAWLYTQYCYRCHQAYAETRMGRGAREADLKKVVENGKTATQMTAFSRAKGGPLKVREIAAILAYISAWERLGAAPALPAGVLVPPTPNPDDLIPIALPVVPPVEGDVDRGAALYAVHCRRCHAESGRGGLGPSLARDWHVVRADLRVRSVVVGGVTGSPMRAWAQARGGPLTEPSVDDLVALILAWSVDRTTPGAGIAVSARSAWQGGWGMVVLVGVPLVVGVAALLMAPDRSRLR